MRKKKIRIIYQTVPSITGGTERFIFNLAKHLNPGEFEPVVYSWSNGKNLAMFRANAIKTKIIKTKVREKLVNFIKRNKIDIAQSNNFDFGLAMAAKKARIPHIWLVAGHISVSFPDSGLKERKYLRNLICALSDKIICPSEFIKLQFKGEKGIDIRKIRFGVDLENLDKIYSSYTLSKKSHRNKERCRIGMVAHLIPQKRHADFIRAAKKVKKILPDAKFFIFGGSYDNRRDLIYADRIRAMVKKIGGYMTLTAFYKNLHEAMAKMDVIVLPSIDEGSSSAIIEAMALGKPVIASNSGGNSELVKNGLTGYLTPIKNSKRLAGAIINVIPDREKAKMLGDMARKRARELFNIKKIAKIYEKLYKEITGS